jgi:RNA polymerase sigma-70 factor (ECF subfamily)
LEQVVNGPDSFAWQRWHALYEPLIRGWLKKHQLVTADCDDIVQDVLTVVVRRLPEFHHKGRVGAFRLWLKTITINCLREHWKRLQKHPGRIAATTALDDWADERGNLSQLWDREHDRHLVQKLLAFLQPEFAPETWRAFQMLVIEDRPAADVAQELGMTPNAVYIAKSRVLTRLRAEAAGLVDDPVPA